MARARNPQEELMHRSKLIWDCWSQFQGRFHFGPECDARPANLRAFQQRIPVVYVLVALFAARAAWVFEAEWMTMSTRRLS